MPRQKEIFGKRASKDQNNKMTVTSKGISFYPSSNKIPSITLYCVGSKRKSVPEGKSNDELHADIVDDCSYSPLVIDDDLNMGDMSGGNYYLKNHTLSQQYCDSNNSDGSSGYAFLITHTLSQCEYSNMLKNIDDDVENNDGDVSSGYVF